MRDTGGLEVTGEELFRQLAPRLRRFAAVVRPADMDVDDVVQEALVRTLAKRPLESLDNPGAYLRTAILHVAINATRRRTRLRLRHARIATPDQALDHYPSDLDDLLRVPPKARAVLYLTVVEQLPYRDAARVVGCSETAARTMASRAMRDLRHALQAEDVQEAWA